MNNYKINNIIDETLYSYLSEVVSFESIDNKFYRLQVYSPKVASKIQAGQYVELASFGGESRPYSVANSDFSSDVLEFHIENKPQSQSVRRLVSSCINQGAIYLSEPKGSVRLLDSTRGSVFISTGSAFSQINSLLGSLLEKETTDHNAIKPMAFLFWLAEDPSERYMDNFACRLEEKFKYFKYFPVDINGEMFNYGSIFPSEVPLNDYNYYICSSFNKSSMLRDTLLARQVRKEQILSDAF